MGRLVGIPHFLSDKAYQEEKVDQTQIRKAKRAILEVGDPIEGSPEKDELRRLQMAIAIRMAEQFQTYILRRTASSKDWDGKPLLNLPPFKTVLGVVEMTDREMDIVLRLGQTAKEEQVTLIDFLFCALMVAQRCYGRQRPRTYLDEEILSRI